MWIRTTYVDGDLLKPMTKRGLETLWRGWCWSMVDEGYALAFERGYLRPCSCFIKAASESCTAEELSAHQRGYGAS